MRESGSPNITMRWIGTWLALLVATLAPAAAHDLFRSESRLVVQGREVSAQLTFNLLDFPGVDQNGDKVVTPEEFAPAFDRVYATILQHYTLNSSGPPVRITRDKYELLLRDGSLAAYKLAFNTMGVLIERLRRMDESIAERLERNNAAAHKEEWMDFQSKLYTGWTF